MEDSGHKANLLQPTSQLQAVSDIGRVLPIRLQSLPPDRSSRVPHNTHWTMN